VWKLKLGKVKHATICLGISLLFCTTVIPISVNVVPRKTVKNEEVIITFTQGIKQPKICFLGDPHVVVVQ